MLNIYSSNLDWKQQIIYQMGELGFLLYDQSKTTVPYGTEEDFKILNIDTFFFSNQQMVKQRNHRYSPTGPGNAIIIKISVRRNEEFNAGKEQFVVNIQATRQTKHKNKFMNLEVDKQHLVDATLMMVNKVVQELQVSP